MMDMKKVEFSSPTGQEATSMQIDAPSIQRSTASRESRKDLALLVRVLLQYLQRVDKAALAAAKEVLKDCERKHKQRDSKFARLADAIHERVRNVVGENHWMQAVRIHHQLRLNLIQQKKKFFSRNCSPMVDDTIIVRRTKMRKRSPPSSTSPESDSSQEYSSTSSLTTSGNEKGLYSTSSTAPSTTTMNPSTSFSYD